jgi:riboflavin biosynthesis pyrimidine reductase
MVTTSGGETVGTDGTTNSLTRGSDRALLALLRDHSDAVVVGAKTIKAEPIPLPVSTPLVIMTRSGNLSGHQLRQRGNDTERLIIATTKASVDTLTLTAGDLELAIAQHVGGNSLLVEGGTEIWKFFAPIIDEVLISVAPPPRESNEGVPPWWPGGHDHWQLSALMTDDSQMLYYSHRTGIRGVPSA